MGGGVGRFTRSKTVTWVEEWVSLLEVKQSDMGGGVGQFTRSKTVTWVEESVGLLEVKQ